MSGCLGQKVLRYNILRTETLAFQLEKSFIKREWVCVEGCGGGGAFNEAAGQGRKMGSQSREPALLQKKLAASELAGTREEGWLRGAAPAPAETWLWQCHVTDG